MIYYTIYVKGLFNQTGYIDIALEDDQLMKDFQTFLDIGIKPHKAYKVANVAGARGKMGQFAIDVTTISAISTNVANLGGPPKPES
jgi:hypothetical protein